MRAGAMKHPVAVELPEGVDADVHVYLTSGSANLNTRVSICGVVQIAGPDGILEETAKMLTVPELTALAQDWRLMTRPEVLAYRKQQQEEDRGDTHHQEGGGTDPAAG